MYEEANVLPRQLLKKATSLSLAGLKALELPSSQPNSVRLTCRNKGCNAEGVYRP